MKNSPNVLIIQTDQQSRWTLSCYGENEVLTPNIDSIAHEGARLQNFYTPSAVCTPSRGCFITGRYPHCNGAFRNGVPLNRDEVTLAHILKDKGYKTGYIGKWHLNGEDYPGWLNKEDSMGFDDCRYMFNCSHHKNVKEVKNGNPVFNFNIGKDEYMTDWLTDKCIDFINDNKDDDFFMMLSIPDPHTPFTVRAPYDTMYNPEKVRIPVSFNQEHIPDWAEYDEWGRNNDFPFNMKNREKLFRQYKSQYLGEVKCIDDNVGRILARLKELDIIDETIIVFTTDHGEYMGEHGMLYKNNLYESAYGIPFLIRWPKKVEKGLSIDETITVVDFQQTILGLMEYPPSGREQGRDASKLLMGEKVPWINEMYIHPNDVPRTGIITREFELAYVGKGWNRDTEFKDHILFDRIKDPHQLNNLYDNPEYKDIVKQLTEKIAEHHRNLRTDPKVLPSTLFHKSVPVVCGRFSHSARRRIE